MCFVRVWFTIHIIILLTYKNKLRTGHNKSPTDIVRSKISTSCWVAAVCGRTRQVQREPKGRCKNAVHIQDCTPRSAYPSQKAGSGSTIYTTLNILKHISK